MNDAELEIYRQTLLALRTTLLAVEETAHDATRIVELDQAAIGRLSRMDAMQAQQMAQETERRRHLQLQKIEGALRRIEADEFGFCYVCGNEIDARRLQADPTITRCLKCAQ
ncbi:MAG: conjugal transfer protein TraR [Gammaproteobacteria bacterium HGW-Gammaproteobacteria-1]|jgi:DnaK suppressor protein|nr:MAG: conjugal transfer protein TraR [Gammaproteobacteria bacterium HGW-Gammaproteobacteria-1]